MTIDLYQFLRDGSLGDARLGMSRAQVESLLGDPYDENIRDNQTIHAITRHGPFQLVYEPISNELVEIYVKTYGPEEHDLRLEGYERISKATMVEFRAILESLEIGYTPVRPHGEPHQYDWLLDSGVQVIFDGETRMFNQLLWVKRFD